jgi:hypothetical protein
MQHSQDPAINSFSVNITIFPEIRHYPYVMSTCSRTNCQASKRSMKVIKQKVTNELTIFAAEYRVCSVEFYDTTMCISGFIRGFDGRIDVLIFYTINSYLHVIQRHR